MQKLHKETIGLDNVAIEPRYSVRNKPINLTVSIDDFKGIPVFASDSTVTGTLDMYEAMSENTMWSFLSTQYDVTELYDFFFDGDKNAVPTFGVTETQKHKWNELKGTLPAGKIKYVNLIHNNPHSIEYLYEVGQFAEDNEGIKIIAGPVSDPYVAARLVEVGASIVKVGFDYRNVMMNMNTSGVGVGHVTSLLECIDVVHNRGGYVMGAGYYDDNADICKVFALGADFVQLEETLIGHTECYGKTQQEDGIMKKNGVEYKGSVQQYLAEVLNSLSEAVSFSGEEELRNLRKARVTLVK